MSTPSRFLHIIYIFELIIANRFLHVDEKSFFIKFLIFILFFSFSLILQISEYQNHKIKDKYNRFIQKYETLFEKYVFTLNDNVNLKRQVKEFDIPTHIKIQYIEYLISKNHTCSICLANIQKEEQVFLTICGHLFHENCINHNFNNSDKCPNCRTYIPKNDLSEEDQIIEEPTEIAILINN